MKLFWHPSSNSLFFGLSGLSYWRRKNADLWIRAQRIPGLFLFYFWPEKRVLRSTSPYLPYQMWFMPLTMTSPEYHTEKANWPGYCKIPLEEPAVHWWLLVWIQKSTKNLFIRSAWLHGRATYLTLFHQLKNKILQMLKLTWRRNCVHGLNQKERQRVHKEWGHWVLLLWAKLLVLWALWGSPVHVIAPQKQRLLQTKVLLMLKKGFFLCSTEIYSTMEVQLILA